MLLLFLLPVVACGLEVFVYLEPPLETSISPSLTSGSAESIATVRFRHNVRNDTVEFLGYEIYYRFYIDIEEDELFQEHRRTVNAADSLRPDRLLPDLGYRRLTRADSVLRPLIRIDSEIRNNEVDVPVDVVFFPTGEEDPGDVPSDDAYARWPANVGQTVFEVITLRRTVDAETDRESFFPIDGTNYNSERHRDVSAAIREAVVDGQTISIGLFVFALGTTLQGVPLYSEAVPLLYANLNDL